MINEASEAAVAGEPLKLGVGQQRLDEPLERWLVQRRAFEALESAVEAVDGEGRRPSGAGHWCGVCRGG